MKKKLLAILITLTLCLSCVTAYAAEEDVSISFRLGDSTLMINGTPVEVETPFATGEGTTLVPLRVITEAFGATVEWEQTEQKITLTYPDVNIVLQINNRYAQVNSHTEELPEAPVLSENGVTMVPLRFISDAYGAEVVWDNGLITVTKYGNTEYGDMVQGMADSDKIGDSYYGWVMNNPKSMLMSERDFDGCRVSFTNDNEDFIDIYVTNTTEDSTFDDFFNEAKALFDGLVLIRQDKLTDDAGNRYFVIQAKYENDYMYIRCYYTPEKVYEVFAGFTAEDNAQRDSFLSIVESFSVSPLTEDVYDLSDVSENGTRTFTDDKYKVSIDLPANFYDSSINENDFVFFSSDEDSNASVHLCIYSISDKATAELFAQHDRDNRERYLNPDFATVEDVITEEINGATVYSYTSVISGSGGNDAVDVDFFFDNGDYLYNCAVSAETKEEAYEIFKTLKTEVLDSEEIGTLLRDYGDNSENITVKSTDWSLQMPGNWTSGETATTGVMMTNKQSIVLFVKLPLTGAMSSREYLQELINQQTASPTVKQVGNIKTVILDNKSYQTAIFKETTDGMVYYSTVYVGSQNGSLIVFMLTENEIFYEAGSYDDLVRMITTLKLQ